MIIVRILGYALGIPAAIAGALLGFWIPYVTIAALLGYADWSWVLGWLVIAFVIGIIGLIGQALVGLSTPDSPTTR